MRPLIKFSFFKLYLYILHCLIQVFHLPCLLNKVYTFDLSLIVIWIGVLAYSGLIKYCFILFQRGKVSTCPVLKLLHVSVIFGSLIRVIVECLIRSWNWGSHVSSFKFVVRVDPRGATLRSFKYVLWRHFTSRLKLRNLGSDTLVNESLIGRGYVFYWISLYTTIRKVHQTLLKQFINCTNGNPLCFIHKFLRNR